MRDLSTTGGSKSKVKAIAVVNPKRKVIAFEDGLLRNAVRVRDGVKVGVSSTNKCRLDTSPDVRIHSHIMNIFDINTFGSGWEGTAHEFPSPRGMRWLSQCRSEISLDNQRSPPMIL